MTRKIPSGPVRNKERTKGKLLRSVGSILKKEGFTGLTVSNVAKKSNVDRKLIYDYYGTLEELVKAYLNSRDYWRVSLDQIDQIIEMSRADMGRQTAYNLLDNQFESLMENEEMRKIITWGLSENSAALIELNRAREFLAEQFFSQLTDDHFAGREKNVRAIDAILVSGIYYLTLNAKMSGVTMCGIDINKEDGRAEIKKALKQIVDWAYS